MGCPRPLSWYYLQICGLGVHICDALNLQILVLLVIVHIVHWNCTVTCNCTYMYSNYTYSWPKPSLVRKVIGRRKVCQFFPIFFYCVFQILVLSYLVWIWHIGCSTSLWSFKWKNVSYYKLCIGLGNFKLLPLCLYNLWI